MKITIERRKRVNPLWSTYRWVWVAAIHLSERHVIVIAEGTSKFRAIAKVNKILFDLQVS